MTPEQLKPVALLPCPFCDSEAIAEAVTGGQWIVICKSCLAQTTWYDFKKQAEFAWNDRPTRPSLIPIEEEAVCRVIRDWLNYFVANVTSDMKLKMPDGSVVKYIGFPAISPDLAKAISARFGVREEPEIVICAAIKLADGFIARGHRHGDCIRHINEKYSYEKKPVEWVNHVQGFITSKNRFVTREEGRILQDAAGIPSVEGYRGNTLFSEDLY